MGETETSALVDAIDEADLVRMRASFDSEAMSKGALGTLGGLHEPAGILATAMLDTMYQNSSLSPRDRELCVLMLIAESGGFPVAVHIYWALMEGVSPRELADALLLLGGYRGIDSFLRCASQTRRVLLALRTLASETEGAISPQCAVGCLRELFAA